MSYPALPDRRMPYHRDGTVVAYGSSYGNISAYTAATTFAQGLTAYLSGSDMIQLNDPVLTALAADLSVADAHRALWLFFPEQREITGLVIQADNATYPFVYAASDTGIEAVEGSSNSTNGVDGTWETASHSGADGIAANSLDGWRKEITSLSFTGGKRVLRIAFSCSNGRIWKPIVLHVYGEKVAGQTPNDLIFIDHDTTPGVEFTAPEDFGDRPLGTTLTRQFRVKNASATLTANTINLQCNDSDFTISTDGTTWVTTINIASLAALAESATLYVRNTTPAPGNLLGPRFAEIVALVGSWV